MNRFSAFLFLLAAGIVLCLQLACNNQLPGSPANALGGPSPTPCTSCGPAASSSSNENYIFKTSWSGPVTSQLNGPWSAVDVDGNIWITDDSNGLIQEDSANGTFIKNIGVGTLDCPEGITRQGNTVYVADDCDNVIYKFDLIGNYLGSISNPGGYSLGDPTDVAVDSQGNIYTTAAGPCDIYKFNPNTNTIKVIANNCTGNAVGGVENPTGIALDQEGDILVADQDNTSRIVTYDNDGNWKNEVYGLGNITFNNIVGIRVDKSDHIFVSDDSNSVIYKGDLSHNLLAQFGGGHLNSPEGLAVNIASGSQVFVPDDNNSQVYSFTGPN